MLHKCKMFFINVLLSSQGLTDLKDWKENHRANCCYNGAGSAPVIKASQLSVLKPTKQTVIFIQFKIAQCSVNNKL